MNLGRTPNPQDLSALFLQMGLLLDSGVGVLECMQSVRTPHKALKCVIDDIAQSLQHGRNLAQSFEKHKAVFGELSCVLLSLGQQSGNLPSVLLELSEYFKKRAQNKAIITKALFYPALVLCAMVGAFLAIIWFVIPPFMVLFGELGVELPIYTQILLWLYEFAHTFGALSVLLLVLIGFITLLAYRHNPTLKHKLDALTLRLPLVGALIISQERYRFSFALSCMLKGALPLDRALPLAAKSVQNHALRSRYHALLGYIQTTAAPLSQALETLSLLDPLSITLVRAGEKSAKLPQIFESIAQNLQTHNTQKLDTLVRLIEPTLSLIMGALIVFLALGVFVPMWDMSANVL